MSAFDIVLSKYRENEKILIFNAISMVNEGRCRDIYESLGIVGVEMTSTDKKICELEMVRNYGKL